MRWRPLFQIGTKAYRWFAGHRAQASFFISEWNHRPLIYGKSLLAQNFAGLSLLAVIWNASHSFAEQLFTLQIIYTRIDTREDGGKLPPQYVQLLNYSCFWIDKCASQKDDSRQKPACDKSNESYLTSTSTSFRKTWNDKSSIKFIEFAPANSLSYNNKRQFVFGDLLGEIN